MIWESAVLMTVIDVVIVCVVIGTIWLVLRQRQKLVAVKQTIGVSVALFGLWLLGLFYLTDLAMMWLLPVLTSRTHAMAIMTDLHLNYSWIVVLVSVVAMAGGFAAISRGLFSLVDALTNAEENRKRKFAELQQAQDALRQAQKMEAVGQLTSGVAHDFNNLLTVVRTNAELIASRESLASAESISDLREIHDAVTRGAALIRNLLTFSRPQKLDLKPTELRAAVDGFVVSLTRLVPETIELNVQIDPAVPPVLSDPAALEQMLVNLITNARDAMPKGGAITVEGSVCRIRTGETLLNQWGGPGDYGCLSVRDTGTGMDRETLGKMFDPFFTTKPVGQGSGLGLAMIYGLIKQHGGCLDAESELEKGTVVRMFFPLAASASWLGRLEGTGGGFEGPRGTETVLVAEDDEPVLLATRHVLERAGYRVLAARDGEEALRSFSEHQDEVALIVTDVLMPRMTGPDLYEAISETGSPVKFIMMSGYTSPDLLRKAAFRSDLPRLEKPWDVATLLTLVRNTLDEVGGAAARDHSREGVKGGPSV